MPQFSPYYKILNAAQKELAVQVKTVVYCYSEELEDYSTVTLESDDYNYVDNVDIQEDKAIYIIWGYIGTQGSETKRKVYIINSDAEFSDNGLVLKLKCLPKAHYLKLNSKQGVRENADLPSVTEEAAGRIGVSVDNKIAKEGLQILKTGFAKPEEIVYDVYQNLDNPNDPRNGEVITRGVASASNSARVRRDYVWKTYPSLPQGNKSDAQLIDEMKHGEPLDNLVISGRDDMVEIKQRDFNQAPILSYVWKGGKGRLLAFTSGIKNDFNRSDAMLQSVDGWVPESKEYIRGDVKNTQEGSTLLAKNLPLNAEELLKNNDPSYPGNTRYFGLFEEFKLTDEEGNEQTSLIKNDELNGNNKFVYRLRKGTVPKRLSKDGYLLEQDIVSRIPTEGIIPVRYQRNNPTIEDNARDIAGGAINDRSNKDAKLNKSSAKALGDPLLMEGKLVNVQQVGKKYSGNWYITKATHVVDQNGWIVEMEITKNARGNVDSMLDNMGSSEELNRGVNSQGIPQEDEYIIPSKISD